jgi:hypothetical protein
VAHRQRPPRGSEKIGDLASVRWNGLVHEGVGVEAAFQVQNLLESGSLKGLGHVRAAETMMADHHGLGAGIEVGKAFRYSDMGISLEPFMRDRSNSHGSRTSRRTGLSPASNLAFSPLAVMFS